MAGPAATPGILIVFENCREHTPEAAIPQAKRVVDVLSGEILVQCAHIHCNECGCIKSRTECVMATPNKKYDKYDAINDLSDGPTIPFYREEVKVTGPENIHFNIEWESKGIRFFCQGNLPPDMSSTVMNTISGPSGLKIQKAGEMRRFIWYRDVDPSGISGTGPVADGIQFPDGSLAVHWRGKRPVTHVWNSLEDMEAIHGHGGDSYVVWIDPEFGDNRLTEYHMTGT